MHNPANRMGIEAGRKLLPGVPQVACFDTAIPTYLIRQGLTPDQVDHQRNAGLRGKEAGISTPDSSVRIFVIPTNEELSIFTATRRLLAAAYKSCEMLKIVTKNQAIPD